ncbi:hypothetical protein CIHG_09394 [Coccidioides immitis H538.4]|uniref:Uncharacterized protein n=2 Tax=Coccidioides immitis TaxID=5501 RepID=A0A0J8S5E4_COCIT|nr:hypothetical protein CIRG_02556 [Coccidioides immitis RMSCC 2394]KMU91584.1 hypothetical protein CIHG_09394 [Coccidioides immitis H538.4]
MKIAVVMVPKSIILMVFTSTSINSLTLVALGDNTKPEFSQLIEVQFTIPDIERFLSMLSQLVIPKVDAQLEGLEADVNAAAAEMDPRHGCNNVPRSEERSS